MRIKNYEFGLVKPLRWNRFWKTDSENPCGCTIWEFGFWYFSILRYECAGEVDTRVEEPKTPVETAILGIAAQLERSLYMTPVEDMKTYTFKEEEPPSQLKKLSVKKVKKARKLLKKLDLKEAVKTAKRLETTKIKLTKKEKKKLTKNLLKKRKK